MTQSAVHTNPREALARQFSDAFVALLRGAPNTDDQIMNERRVFEKLLETPSGEMRYDAPVTAPVCRVLPGMAAPGQDSSAHGDLLNVSLSLSEHAVWRNKYRARPEYAHLFENFAFCDFVGPDGWQGTEDVTLGLVLMGPHCFYPFHHHPARELYYVLSGTAEWAVDFQPPQVLEPGSWLLHQENQPHAMQTGHEPMLAVSAWRGDILSRSQFSTPYVGPAPTQMPSA